MTTTTRQRFRSADAISMRLKSGFSSAEGSIESGRGSIDRVVERVQGSFTNSRSHLKQPMRCEPRTRASINYSWRVPRALITGITGQDGMYLGELLTARSTRCSGWCAASRTRRFRSSNRFAGVELIQGDLRPALADRAIEIAQPTRCTLGAISFVGLSWRQAELTATLTGWACSGCSRRSGSRPANDIARSLLQASSRRDV